LGWVGSGLVRSGQVRLVQVGLGWVRSGQVGLGNRGKFRTIILIMLLIIRLRFGFCRDSLG
jgi:hypothetical protein